MSGLEGAIDLHVHAGPDVRPRKMTAVELARAAQQAGMRGLLLKNHESSTVLAAGALREMFPGLAVFGGLVLNDAVGGFNPAAVETALRMGAAEIWMPTHCAEQERAYRGRAGTGLRLSEAPLAEILRLIAEADAVLGTGHLSPAEIVELSGAARQAGVRRILITHPEIRFVNLPVDVQLELRGHDVFFERCYVRDGFVLNWDKFAEVIRRVGVESTVLATDLGQPENPDPVTGFAEMRQQLLKHGFTEAEWETMACRNPAALLKLP